MNNNAQNILPILFNYDPKMQLEIVKGFVTTLNEQEKKELLSAMFNKPKPHFRYLLHKPRVCCQYDGPHFYSINDDFGFCPVCYSGYNWNEHRGSLLVKTEKCEKCGAQAEYQCTFCEQFRCYDLHGGENPDRYVIAPIKWCAECMHEDVICACCGGNCEEVCRAQYRICMQCELTVCRGDAAIKWQLCDCFCICRKCEGRNTLQFSK